MDAANAVGLFLFPVAILKLSIKSLRTALDKTEPFPNLGLLERPQMILWQN
jgi:hypothetical protein